MKLSTHISEFEPPIPNPRPWIDKASALYKKIISEKKGKVVFLAGELGSGKSSVIRSLNKAFSGIKPSPGIIARCFYHGDLQNFIPEINPDINQGVDTAGNIASMAAKIVSPRLAESADLAGQLLQTSASHIQLIKAHSASSQKMPETPHFLRELIRKSVEANPVVCIIDDFDEAQDVFGWNIFLLSLAEEIAVSSPVLFIVSITGKAEIGEHRDDEPDLEFTTRELVHRGLAEWWHLKPMTREDISEWIPLETGFGIVGQLHGVTGGQPRWVQNLWRDWRVGGAVYFDEQRHRWEWSPDKKPGLNIFKSVLEDLLILLLETSDPRRIAEAKKVLGYAALEGTVFTAKALASALNWGNEETENYLDDYFVRADEKPNGILYEVGFVEVKISPTQTGKLFRYGFISNWHWHVLDHSVFTGPGEKKKTSEEMIGALQKTYENDEKPAARSLARLCKFIDRKKAARHYQRIVDYSLSREVMHEYALALIQVDIKDWSKIRCRHAAEFLLKAGLATNNCYPHMEVLEVFEKMEELAVRASVDSLKMEALLYISHTQMELGELKIAGEKANRLYDIVIKSSEKRLTVEALTLLGRVMNRLGECRKAVRYCEQAAEIVKQLDNQTLKSDTFNYLGEQYINLGEYAKTITYHEQALEIIKQLRDRNREVTSYGFLGSAYLESGENKKSIEHYEQSLEIIKETGNKYVLFVILIGLRRNYIKDDPQKAIEYLEQSLLTALELGGLQTEGVIFTRLGQAYHNLGHPQKAIEYFTQALEILKDFGFPRHKGRCLFYFGNLYYDPGKKEKAVSFWKDALAVLEAVESPLALEVRESLEKAKG